MVPRPWPWYGSSGSMAGFGDASTMERLLVHFAAAVEANDATLAQQILWVLNNIAPSDGDSNQRLTCGFLRALILRAMRNGTCKTLAAAVASSHSGSNICLSRETYRFSVVELAAFVDLTPWHRFGFTAANSAIVEAIQGFSAVHVVEIGSTHCMQIPTLIDAIANKFEVPPLVKLTVVVASTADDDISSLPIAFSYEELGSKLVNFAHSRNVNVVFRIITSSYTNAFSSLFEDLRKKKPVQVGTCDGGSIIHQEALVINCQMMLHYMLEDQALELIPPLSILEGAIGFSSPRTRFLNWLRSLDPTIVTLVDEDADLMSNDIVTRLRSAFNYLWIPYDVSDAILPKGSEQRQREGREARREAQVGGEVEGGELPGGRVRG
ncbi:hypothetical protein MLD38_003326 [Melastoma candidum]|uniref:Uncharacterized protein n=1 Tax=Melastoma candidum TaxID=119954 RepID=A0ACB9S2W3_9MYRT|nr:hypothetical protein MLD38_003326 [Melastoma candidum]